VTTSVVAITATRVSNKVHRIELDRANHAQPRDGAPAFVVGHDDDAASVGQTESKETA
jgi:hypothetical protein